MKTIFRIFLRDLRRLSTNVIALIVTMGLCIIPSLYAWFNIAAMWDPYGSTSGVQVAVANNDKGFSGNMLKLSLNAGDAIVTQLKANKAIGWQFVNEADAVEGVKSGKYYAAIVIPADFSKHMASIMTGSIENPKLNYYTNEKKNAVAPKITDTGANTVQKQVNSTFISIATEAVASALNTASGALSSDKTTIMDRLVTSLKNAEKDLEEFSRTIDTFSSAADSVQSLLDTAKASLPDVDKIASDGNKALSSANSVLDASRTSLNNITNTFGNVIDSSQNLYDQVSGTANSALGQIEGDAESTASRLSNLASAAQQIININNESIQTLQQLNTSLPKPLNAVNALITKLQDANKRQQAIIDRVNGAVSTIRTTKDLSAKTRNEISNIVKQSRGDISGIRSDYRSSVQPKLDSLIDSLSGAGSSLSGVLSGTQSSLSNLDGVLNGVGKTMDASQKALASAKTTLDSMRTKLSSVISQLNSVSRDKQLQKLIDILKTDPSLAGSFMSSPVRLDTHRFYSVENYGSGMAPFYSSLAIWVGGIVLVAIMKVKVDEDDKLHNFKLHQAYLGRYLIFMTLGLIQSLIICLGDLYFLQIQCLFPLHFLLAGLVSSFIYINIIYALTVSFGNIGKALSVILLVIQIGSSGGTFPIETMPAFFQKLYPILPFTYSINAMRESIAGIYQNAYAIDLLKLLLYVPIALLLGLFLRRPLIRLNEFFNKRLEDSKLM